MTGSIGSGHVSNWALFGHGALSQIGSSVPIAIWAVAVPLISDKIT